MSLSLKANPVATIRTLHLQCELQRFISASRYRNSPPMSQFLSREIGPPLPRLNFIKIHWIYFIITCFLFSAIFWGSSQPHGSVAYIDSLFLVIAAMTQAGMNTVNLSSLNTFQQCLLAVLIVSGNQISVSAVVVYVRKRAFEKKFKSVTKAQEKQEPTITSLFDKKPLPEKYSDLRSRPQTLHRAHSKIISIPH